MKRLTNLVVEGAWGKTSVWDNEKTNRQRVSKRSRVWVTMERTMRKGLRMSPESKETKQGTRDGGSKRI